MFVGSDRDGVGVTIQASLRDAAVHFMVAIPPVELAGYFRASLRDAS